MLPEYKEYRLHWSLPEASKHQEHTFLLGDRPGLASIFNLPKPSSQLPCRPKAKTRTKDQIYKKLNNQNDKQIPYSPTKSQWINLAIASHKMRQCCFPKAGTSTLKPDLFSVGKDVFFFARNLQIQYYMYEHPGALNNLSKPDDCLMKLKPHLVGGTRPHSILITL